jgi:hypothetical protein
VLIETPQPNLVAGMRRLNGVYTQAFNYRRKRPGHVFQGRYKSILVDKEFVYPKHRQFAQRQRDQKTPGRGR